VWLARFVWLLGAGAKLSNIALLWRDNRDLPVFSSDNLGWQLHAIEARSSPNLQLPVKKRKTSRRHERKNVVDVGTAENEFKQLPLTADWHYQTKESKSQAQDLLSRISTRTV